MRHPDCCPLKHRWHRTTGLDQPKLLAAPWIDEDVKAWAAGEGERAGTVWVDRIGSGGCSGVDDKAIDADGGEWTDEGSISVEIDAFYDGFRLRHTTYNVPSVGIEYIQSMQSLDAASLRRGLRPRRVRRPERHCDHADQRTGEE